MQISRTTTSPFDEDEPRSATLIGRASSKRVDIEQLSADLADLADGHACATCQRSPGHRFELLRTLGARLQPEARDRLELIALAGHLAWAGRDPR